MDLTKLAAWGAAALLAVVALTRMLGGAAAADTPSVRLDSAPGAAPGATVEGAGGGVEAPGGGATGAGGTGVGAGGASGDGLQVHVAGAVRRPGVYQVPPGSRVVAAVDAAGGLGRRADPAGVNLAAPLQDGQQVVVPERGRSGGGTTGAAGATAGAGGAGAGGPAGAPGAVTGARISLSTATVEQLETLDGIGPALAARIIEYRDAHGGFRSIDELQEVDGIGEKRFAALRDAVQP